MRDQQEQEADDDRPFDAEDRAGAEHGDEVGIGVGDLAAHQHRRDAIGDLHHGERHDEGGDADPR